MINDERAYELDEKRTPSFADRICDEVLRKGTPAIVGVDPQWEYIPAEIRAEAIDEYGPTLYAVAEAFNRFAAAIIVNVADLVPAVKFQLAFFEQAGVEGMRALGQLAELAHREGLLVIFDGKRNDIGNTAEAYAKAYLGGWTPIDPNTAAKLELFGAVTETKLYPWPADALTVSPYMGPDTLEPFLKQARDHATGVFVLVRTSNPGAGKLQDLKLGDSTPAHLVADWVDDWNRKELELRPSKSGYGSAGAVVGATVPKQLVDFRKRLTRSILLVPGYGAQGGSAADVAGAFDEQGLGALVNNSRGILYAYRSNDSSDDWRIAARAAAERMIDELARKTPAGNLRV